MDVKWFFEYLLSSKLLKNYFTIVPWRVPIYVYAIIIVFVVIFGTIVLFKRGFRDGIRIFIGYTLAGYILLLISSTCIFREIADVRSYCLVPFWSYHEINRGNTNYVAEIVINILAFIPVGLLLPCFLSEIRFFKVLLFGVALSFTIELLQFFMKTGYSEIDDLFHNFIGTLIGYCLYSILFSLFKVVKRFSRSLSIRL